MIKSKFNFLTVYLKGFVLSALVLIGLYFVSHPGIKFRGRTGDMTSVEGPGLLLILSMGFLLYLLLRKTIILKIDAEQLSLHSIFGRHSVSRSEISTIYLTRIKKFQWSYDRGEALTIETNDERLFFLADSYYRNMPEIRQFLNDRYDGLVFKPKLESKNDTPAIYSGQGTRTFYGDYKTAIISFYVLFFTIVLMSIYLYRSGYRTMGNLLPLFILLPYYLIGSELFYFRIKEGQLEIKNRFWNWFSKSYPLSSIVSINFEMPYRGPNRLCIRTKDFRLTSYSGGRLRKENWAELASTLKEINIPVYSDFPMD